MQLSIQGKHLKLLRVLRIQLDMGEIGKLMVNLLWSKKLHGYFSTDWSHLWLPYNGNPNQIKVEHENHMKHTMLLRKILCCFNFVNS
jgi:hypothetical protein